MLDNAHEILAQTGLRVQRPSEIIAEIDSVIRSDLYQYRELQNTGVERHRVSKIGDIDIERFTNYRLGETVKQFTSLLDGALSLPTKFEIQHLRDSRKQSLALVVVESADDKVRAIKRIRIAKKLAGTRLGNVLTEMIACQPLGAATSSSRLLIQLDDPCVEPFMQAKMQRRGFLSSKNKIWRVALPGIWNRDSLTECLNAFVADHGLPIECANNLLELAERCESEGSAQLASELECFIMPGKINFGFLPTFVIPIEPVWAQELFDHRIWRYPLLEMDTKLVLNPDSVYYKKPRNSPKGNFCRILWYVSGPAKKGGNRITACSVMTKGVHGIVKDLFREYRRLGVFEWKHLMNHFKSPTAEAFAIEFTNTELFPNPIRLDDVNNILVKAGMKRQLFPSALEINPVAFQELYRLATKES